MDPRILFLFIILCFIGGSLFVNAILSMHKKRKIENIPTSKIRSLAMGLVEIYGKVLHADKWLFTSPLAGKKCVYYDFEIEEHRGSGKNSRWVTVAKGCDGRYFFLKDNTGRVLVDCNGAKIEIKPQFKQKSMTGLKSGDLPENVKKVLEKNGIKLKNFFGFDTVFKYQEMTIVPEDNLYIMGNAGDNPFVKEGSAMNSTHDIMIQCSKDTFFISNKDEKHIINNLKLKIILGFFGGIPLIFFGGLGILFYFSVILI